MKATRMKQIQRNITFITILSNVIAATVVVVVIYWAI